MGLVARRFDVFQVDLDPTRGSEIKKTRPCLVVSPDELNGWLATVIVVPLTSKGTPGPFRVPCKLQGREGLLVLDQIRTVDKTRLVRKLGRLSTEVETVVLETLADMFSP